MAAITVMEPTAALLTNWAVSRGRPPSSAAVEMSVPAALTHHRHRRRTIKAGQRIDAGELGQVAGGQDADDSDVVERRVGSHAVLREGRNGQVLQSAGVGAGTRLLMTSFCLRKS